MSGDPVARGNGGPPPPSHTKTKEPIPFWVFLAMIVIGGVALLSFNFYYIFYPQEVYLITSNGESTFSIYDGKLVFILNNNLSTPNKVMTIYGLNRNMTNFTISASKMVEDKSGSTISSGNILFNNTTPLQIHDISPWLVTIFIDHIQTGLYHGSIFITGISDTSIPITVDIKPTLDRVVIWVINGIAISIIFWKIVKFYNQRYEHIQDNTYKILRFGEFLKEKKITWGTIGKNLILDLGSILFGILTGAFALLNNTFITELHILDIPSILVLVGIGLGIGSLKEVVYTASEPKN